MIVVTSALTEAAESQRVHAVGFELGVGYDTNPYLSPDQPYFDQNSRKIVVPEQSSGFFFPVRLAGDLLVPLGAGHHTFITTYRVKGNIYSDPLMSNADETWAKLEPGFLFRLGGSPKRERVLEVRPYATYSQEVYFDRDTGLPATSDGVDLSDRYTYSAVGGELLLEFETSRTFSFYIDAQAESRSYRDTGVVDPLDHDRYRAGTGMEFRLGRRVLWSFDYGQQTRQYSARFARSPDGSNDTGNPLLTYAFQELGTNLRVRPRRGWHVDVGWHRTQRDDRYVGYNDYREDALSIRAQWRSDGVRLRLFAGQRNRRFDKAFIFDEPLHPVDGTPNPTKSFLTLDYRLTTEMTWTRHLRPYTSVRYLDQQAADPRFDYTRAQFSAGLKLSY